MWSLIVETLATHGAKSQTGSLAAAGAANCGAWPGTLINPPTPGNAVSTPPCSCGSTPATCPKQIPSSDEAVTRADVLFTIPLEKNQFCSIPQD